MKAATVFAMLVFLRIIISIHAAREGGDAPRSLGRCGYGISIHAAREGGDVDMAAGDTEVWEISIHAAREGGDGVAVKAEGFCDDFNPRRP